MNIGNYCKCFRWHDRKSYFRSKSEKAFDISITPNRADCLGIRGIARDLSSTGNKNSEKSFKYLHLASVLLYLLNMLLAVSVFVYYYTNAPYLIR